MQSAEKLWQMVVITVRHVGVWVCVCVCVRACTPTYHTHPPNRSWGGELYPLYLWCVGHPHRLFVGLNSSTFMKGKALLKTLLSW